eukprot:ANDGO_05627.mRNA.1 Urea transporter DVU1160
MLNRKHGWSDRSISQTSVASTAVMPLQNDRPLHLAMKDGRRQSPQSSASPSGARWKDLLGEAKALQEMLVHRDFCSFVDATLRGISQVFFANNPLTAVMFLIAIFVDNWYLGVCCLIGTVSATGFSILFGVDRVAVQGGLMGYAGCLTAMAMGYFTFGGPSSPFPMPYMLIFMVLMSSLSVLFSVFIGSVCGKQLGIPTFTFPFHLATWSWLLASQSSLYFFVNGGVLSPSLKSNPLAFPSDISPVSYSVSEIFRSFLTSISQVFFLENPISGAICLLGLAVASRIMAFSCLIGSVFGVLFAMALGIPAKSIYMGLWGYNPCLSGIALGGLFLVARGRKFFGLWVFAVLATTIVHGAVGSFLLPFGLPTLTFPFTAICWVVALSCQSLQDVATVELAAASIPEEVLDRYHRSQSVFRLLPLEFDSVVSLGKRLTLATVKKVEDHLVPTLAAHFLMFNEPASLAYLIDLQLNVCKAGAFFQSALHAAALGTSSESVDLLMRASSMVNGVSYDAAGFTPLLYAVLLQKPGIAARFSARQWSLRSEYRDVDLAFLMCCATAEGDLNTLQLFVDAGCLVDAADYAGRTCLGVAVTAGHLEVVRYLVEDCGARISVTDSFSQDALSFAESHGHQRVVEFLETLHRSAGAQQDLKRISAPMRYGSSDTCSVSPFCPSVGLEVVSVTNAVAADDVDRLRELSVTISSSELFCCRCFNGERTLLHVAAAHNSVHAAHFLVQRNADPFLADCLGMLPLQIALENRNCEVAHFFLREMNSLRPTWKLHSANVPLREYSGAAVVKTYARLWTVCRHAVDGDATVLSSFFSTGIVSSSILDFQRRSPLHLAVAAGNTDAVQVLLQAGVSPLQVDVFGHSPLDYARSLAKHDIADLLSQVQ